MIPGLGRSPGEGNRYPFQYSALENPNGQRSLVGCSPWRRKESGTTEQLRTAHQGNSRNTQGISKASRARQSQWEAGDITDLGKYPCRIIHRAQFTVDQTEGLGRRIGSTQTQLENEGKSPGQSSHTWGILETLQVGQTHLGNQRASQKEQNSWGIKERFQVNVGSSGDKGRYLSQGSIDIPG